MSNLLFGIELVLVFGLVVALAAWDYRRTSRKLEESRRKEERARDGED